MIFIVIFFLLSSFPSTLLWSEGVLSLTWGKVVSNRFYRDVSECRRLKQFAKGTYQSGRQQKIEFNPESSNGSTTHNSVGRGKEGIEKQEIWRLSTPHVARGIRRISSWNPRQSWNCRGEASCLKL